MPTRTAKYRLVWGREQGGLFQTVAVQRLIKPQLRRSGNNRTPRRSRIGIAPPPLTLIKPPRTLNRAKETPRRSRIGIAPPPLTLIKPPRTLNRAKETPRRSRIGIAPPPLAQTKLPRMLNRAKETRRRNRSETGLLPQPRISNSSKHCWIAKNCAPNCCNNSTSFLSLAIPPVVSS